MMNKLTALAISIALCSNVTVPLANAAVSHTTTGPKIPLIKTAVSQSTSQVELTLGKAQIVHLSVPASRVSISDPAVVGLVLISPTEVELIGKAVGVANLLVWGEGTGQNFMSIDLSVHRDVSTLARKIQMIDPGINILPVAAEDSVILTGIAESIEKAELAYDLAKAFFSGGDGKDTAGSAAGGAGGGTSNSNAPGSAINSESSSKIINLIRVIGQPTTRAEMVQQRLNDINSSIKLDVVPGYGGKEKAILTGRVKTASEVSKAVNLTSVFYGTPGIKILTGPGGNVVKESKEVDTANFTAGSGDTLIGNLSGNVLHGSIVTDTSGNVVSMLEVERRPQIKCHIHFLEVQKNSALTFGASSILSTENLKLSTFAGSFAQSTPAGLVGQVNGATAAQVGYIPGREFATLLNGLVTSGKVRVLADPTITSISGEPAFFLAGGEFPYQVLGPNNVVTIYFKQFGILLNIMPTVTDRGTIHMQVSPEVSSLDFTSGTTINGIAVPALRVRRSQTVLELKNGQDFVLSGLYNDNMTDNYSKTPLLGQLPIVGALFRSRAFQRQETEMLIVIHPEVEDQATADIKPAQPTSTPIKQSYQLDPNTSRVEIKSEPIPQVSQKPKETKTEVTTAPTATTTEEVIRIPAEAIQAQIKAPAVQNASAKASHPIQAVDKGQSATTKASNPIQTIAKSQNTVAAPSANMTPTADKTAKLPKSTPSLDKSQHVSTKTANPTDKAVATATAFMAQEQARATVNAAIGNRLDTQKDELTNLLDQLQTNPTGMAPLPQIPIKLNPLKKAPVVPSKTIAVTQPIAPVKASAQPNPKGTSASSSHDSKSSNVVEEKPSKNDPKAAIPAVAHSKVAKANALEKQHTQEKARQVVQQHIQFFQKQLSQLLSLN